MPNHFSYQALNMERQSFCHACSPSSLRRQLTSSRLWAISAFASLSAASTSSSMSLPPAEYSLVVCLRKTRLCLINSSILPSLIVRTSRELRFVAILTLCSLIMEKVLLSVTRVSAEVALGEIADFLVFAVG